MLPHVYQVRQRRFKKMGYLFIRRSSPPPTILSSGIIAPLGVGAIAKVLLQLFSADRSPSADCRTPFWHISDRERMRSTTTFGHSRWIELIGAQGAVIAA